MVSYCLALFSAHRHRYEYYNESTLLHSPPIFDKCFPSMYCRVVDEGKKNVVWSVCPPPSARLI
ncbi:hypothetical protein E2C01_030424 [Portunus trituberculatus]|uniref:Uncharacterized protein n=1 Tax=Portunus trituberculatus TaxID=210409 RepID=A0A5B7ES12_PORTR|nr:hypothetical protein [Portunus trituberculatus]